MKNVIAIDLGASSGRLISGVFDGEKIETKEQFRFSNQPVNILGEYFWDYIKIFQEIKHGLAIAEKNLGKIDSISVDTWGVDYKFLDKKGMILRPPHSYRDNRVKNYINDLKNIISEEKLFTETGVNFNKINTIVQLFSDIKSNKELTVEIGSILMMPNMFEYLLSGKKSTDFSIISTSGLLNSENGNYSDKVFNSLQLKHEWFTPINKNGQILDDILPNIREELELESKPKIISGVGHDTAAALESLRNMDADTAFISCGTWSIVGKKVNKPVISDLAMDAGLTNEGCLGGSYRLLKNITGLWIVQELQKEWAYQGEMVSWQQMQDMANTIKDNNTYIDPNNEVFSQPGNMEEKIRSFAVNEDCTILKSKAEILRCVYESLAISYAKTIKEIEKATNTKLKNICMFGGGIQNKLLVQLTADYTGKSVYAGPIEASSFGNIISQLEILGDIKQDEKENIITNSLDIEEYAPKKITEEKKQSIVSFERHFS